MQPGLLDMLQAEVRRSPDHIACIWRSASWRYADLARAAASVEASLRHLGSGSGLRVALLLRNSPHYVACYYGALAAGHVVVPLNAQERAPVLARQVEHCGAAVLVGDPSHPEWEALAGSIDASVALMPVALADGEHSLGRFLASLPAQADQLRTGEFHPDAPASIIYTSGTTGRPKGVVLSGANLAANTSAIISYLGLHAGDRGLCVLPFHFSYGNSVLHTHMAVGATLVIEENFAFPHLVAQKMADQRITGFAGVPATFAVLLTRVRLEEFDLSSLRYVTQAGGAMPRPLVERLRNALPDAQLFVMYGQTEATARLSYLPPVQLDAKAGSVGIAIPGVELQVRDADGKPLPAGQAGEIWARGPNIMQGYWADPAATREVLFDGWLRTGDLGRCDADGYLYIDGRAVDMIKVGAFRVSPQEVEEAILTLPGVAEVGVTAIPEETLGHAIKAVVVAEAGAALDERAVKAHCRRQLASYKIPKVVEFAASLPRTASGKIQRFKLA